MDGIVPAAGEGTRLRPLTAERPKVLVPVNGRPLIEYSFDRLLSVGADRLVVVIGYRGADVVDRYGDAYRDRPIRYVRQDDRLGVAHALALAGERARTPAVVCHGDLVFGSSLGAVAKRHRETDAAVTLSVDTVSLATARTTGVCVFRDGRLVDLVEKPDDPPSRTAIVGAYAVGPAFFDACSRIDPSDRGEYELPDAVTALLDDGHRVETVPVDGWWANVNGVDDVERTERLLEERGFSA